MRYFQARHLAAFAAVIMIAPALGQATAMAPTGMSRGGMPMGGASGRMLSHSATFPFGHPGRASAVDRVIHIIATEFKFSPATVTVEVGETVKFVITNEGVVDHEFILGTAQEQKQHDREMAAHPNAGMTDPNGVSIAKGATASLIWTFTRPMTMQYACHVPGHYRAGMYGTLKVVPAVHRP